MENDWMILRDGLAVFEAKDICRKLETGKVDFKVEQVSGEEAGIVYSRRDNWSAGLSKALNYFNQGGLGVLLRISVRPEDHACAEAVLAPRAVSATTRRKWLGVGAAGVMLFLLLVAVLQRIDRDRASADEEEDLLPNVSLKTVEERTATVVKAMKQLQVKEFEAKVGEEIAQVVARLHELAKPGLPGLPPERSGISILLKSRPQEREQAEVLRKGFRVEDVSFYDVVGSFCAAVDYEFKVDGGYLRIAPTGTGFPDIDRHEPADEELCGHSPITDEERKLLRRMLEMRLPQISFRPPATLKDAVDFLIMASHPVGEPETKIEIVIQPAQSGAASPALPEISASDISLYETAQLVSTCVGYKMEIRGNKVYFQEMTGCELAPK